MLAREISGKYTSNDINGTSFSSRIYYIDVQLNKRPAPHCLCLTYTYRASYTNVMVYAWHYSDVIMSTMASKITGLTFVYSTIYTGADQRKHQSSATLAFVRGIHRSTVKSPHKGPVMRKMFPFDDVIMSMTLTAQKYLLLGRNPIS